MRSCLLSLLALLLIGTGTRAQVKANEYTVTIKADRHDREDLLIVVPLSLQPREALLHTVVVNLEGGGRLLGQLTAPGLHTAAIEPDKGLVRRDLHFRLSRLPAGKDVKASFELSPQGGNTDEYLMWTPKQAPDSALLKRGNRSVLGYVHDPYDDSSPDKRNRTYKVFHHLWSPDGKHLVTNGGHTDDLPKGPKLQYPHHRGLVFGFNRISYDEGKKKADTWHCQKDDHLSHQKFLAREEGPVLGRHRVLIHWHGPGKEVFAHEEREVAVYNTKGGTMVEWSTLLKTTGGPVTLDGDPQHAGFQFRAANEVAVKHEKETYFLRPDGKGKPNETRNWPMNKEHVNLPWNAMCFKLGEKRYTVAYLDHQNNPREARHSERAYGRFGYYFKYELTKERPLRLSYRVWLQDGEMTGEQVTALQRNFAEPLAVSVKAK